MSKMSARQKQGIMATTMDTDGNFYFNGKLDGIWGPESQKAAERFLRDFTGQVEEAPQKPPDSFWDDIEFFKRWEFRCPCPRCGGFPVEPDEIMVRNADEIRRRLGVPVSVVDGGGSGVRCPEHNAEVGGVNGSQHILGKAADLHSSKSPEEMYRVAEEVMGNTGGIGIYDWGIHIDNRGTKARWDYRGK